MAEDNLVADGVAQLVVVVVVVMEVTVVVGTFITSVLAQYWLALTFTAGPASIL